MPRFARPLMSEGDIGSFDISTPSPPTAAEVALVFFVSWLSFTECSNANAVETEEWGEFQEWMFLLSKAWEGSRVEAENKEGEFVADADTGHFSDEVSVFAVADDAEAAFVAISSAVGFRIKQDEDDDGCLGPSLDKALRASIATGKQGSQ